MFTFILFAILIICLFVGGCFIVLGTNITDTMEKEAKAREEREQMKREILRLMEEDEDWPTYRR